jgi:rfaE bifunctional protein kinase chain/domain
VEGDRLLQLIDDFSSVRVAVFGDLIVDEFIYGEIARVSREAPVLILNYDSTQIVPGGAGNAANNVAALGGTAVAIGVAGSDETGLRMLEVMRERVDIRGVVRAQAYRTPTKTRILAGGIHSAKQQVVRIDRAARPALTDADRRAVESKLVWAAARCDALLVSDYGSGLVTPAIVSRTQRRFRTPGRQVPVLVDSRYSLLRYRGICSAFGSGRTRESSRRRDASC